MWINIYDINLSPEWEYVITCMGAKDIKFSELDIVHVLKDVESYKLKRVPDKFLGFHTGSYTERMVVEYGDWYSVKIHTSGEVFFITREDFCILKED